MASPRSRCIACERIWKTAHGAYLFKCIVQGINILGGGAEVTAIQPPNHARLSFVIAEIQPRVEESRQMSEYSSDGRTKTEMFKMVTSPEAVLGAAGGV